MITLASATCSDQDASITERGSLVPLIASWPGTTPPGKVSQDMIDSTDFLPTFAELAGAKLPQNTIIDGRSFAAQLRGEKGQPREWIFIELARQCYAREAGWKLNQAGGFFDMSHAPFEEKLVAAGAENPEAAAVRKRLQAALDKLNPGGGILDSQSVWVSPMWITHKGR